jgi:hypothetical protein
MINVIENSNAQVCNYDLVSLDGELLEKAKLTKYEARMKNYAFGLNHVDKRYILVSCKPDSLWESVQLILPD